MTGNILARRYAKALFAIGAKKGEKDMQAFGSELNGVADVFASSPALLKVVRNPVFGPEEKKAILAKLIEKMKPSRTVANFLSLLADKNRLAAVSDIAAVYSALLDEASGVMRGNLTTAVEMKKDRQAAIKTKLEKQLGKKLVLDFAVDPKILGGLVLKVGDKVMDASLRAQLKNLKDNILRGE